ncbi:tetratricopeptide repeat protein [Bradyrhizobium canariense]|uniref:protein O-GlcNAc transferase n=1 Tax=Bradyrhizobium canariense TaxID=255045 RepID=A0A1H1P541_9BRAD|nr:tetratricopeptide repeat protein [Bradyrhizobium canariense]SDS06307.1 Predicted O-linked N-acetylglucosamine transferase, SPINDLY family [Bradyrhizobium canariense]
MSNRDEAQSLQLAFSLHRSGKFAEAAKLYRKIIKRNPRESNALHSLGIIEAADGNLGEAARLMARSLSVQTTNVQFMQNYATVLCQLGDFETAGGVCLKGLEIEGANAYLLYVAAGALLKQNRLQDSLSTFDRLLSREPNHVAAITERSSVLLALKQHDAALAGIDRALALDPQYAEAHLNRAVLYGQLKRHDEALASFDKALRLNPNLADAWLGLGNVLFELERFDDALVAYDRAQALRTNLDEAWLGRGNVFYELRRYSEASLAYDKALALRPGSAEGWVGRGNVARELKQYEAALACFDKALALDAGAAAAWLGRGNVFLELLRHEEALAAFDAALAAKAGSVEAWLGRGNALLRLKRFDEAFAAYDNDPGLAEAWVGLGNVFYELRRYREAVSAYDQAIALKPGLAEAWNGRANMLREFKQYDEALIAYDKTLSLRPGLTGAESARINVKNCVCNWAGWDADCARLISSVKSGSMNAGPFEFLAVPSTAQDQLDCAKSWIKVMYPPSRERLWQGERYVHDRIRIAYLSSDFREHPVAQLTAGLFEHHDKSRFEITAISWERSDNSELRKRLEACFERFIDVETHSDDEVARLIKSLEIDIVVDLTGLTKLSRTNIVARRPSPIQVNYLGYPGTMGAEYMDYIIADPTLIPPSHQDAYMEKIVRLPHSYMPHDDTCRRISDRSLARADFGLPASGFVFCCFNNSYKLNPRLFRSRMKLLKAVDRSVLWLSENNASAVKNLRAEATAAGVDPDRLVFAGRLPSAPDHMARHRLADLFLDTLPYNAHTTASDALWAGLPVLTQLGETFAGRVAAGLLTALDLPELIAETQEQFESIAIELATRPDALAAIKAKLAQNRLTRPLFNTELYTRHIESAYTTMYARHQSGLLPDHIDVPQ